MLRGEFSIIRFKKFLAVLLAKPSVAEDEFRYSVLGFIAPICLFVFSAIAYLLLPLQYGITYFDSGNFVSLNFIILATSLSMLLVKKNKANWAIYVFPLMLAASSFHALYDSEIIQYTPYVPWYAGTIFIIFVASLLNALHGICFIFLYLASFMGAILFFNPGLEDALHRSNVLFMMAAFAIGFAWARKKLFLEMEEKNNELIQLSNLQTLAELSAGIAHEINNPLTIISGKIEQSQELIEREDFDKKSVLEKLSLARETVFRISKIIRSLLDIARKSENQELDYVEVSALFDDAFVIMQESIKKNGINFNLELEPGENLIRCIPVQITQVILNMMSNSIDAIKGMEQPWIRINVSKHEKQYKFDFEDSGLGIPSELADKIMSPFYTTKASGKGTGLGLSITNRIVKSHHGRMSLNKESANTKFSIYLPIESEQW